MSTEKNQKSQIEKILDMGFTQKQAEKALLDSKDDIYLAINSLVNQKSKTESNSCLSSKNPEKNLQKFEKVAEIEKELSQAIENSIKYAQNELVFNEVFISPNLKRKNGVPVGLLNIGNTCYFNSLIQFYFMIPSLVLEILNYSCHPFYKNQEIPSDESQKLAFVRKKAGICLVENLQRLISFMICSHKKFIDPTSVLNCIVDDFGQEILIGDQKDVGEFHMILVGMIEEGLKTQFLSENEKKNFFNDQSLLVPYNCIVSQLFYAKQVEYLKIVSSSNRKIKNNATFAQIILDVEEKELYSA